MLLDHLTTSSMTFTKEDMISFALHCNGRACASEQELESFLYYKDEEARKADLLQKKQSMQSFFEQECDATEVDIY